MRALEGTILGAVLLAACLPDARGQVEPAPPPPPAPMVPERTEELPPPIVSPPLPPPPDSTGPPKIETPFDREGFSPLANPVVGHLPPRIDYRVTWFPAEGVAGQPTNLGYVEQDFNLLFPLWQDPCNELSLTTNIRNESFQTHAILPSTGQPFPDELWNIRFGATYRHLFDNGWIAGGSVNFGSASDKPFHSIDEMTAGINAFLRLPSGEHNAWLFSLAYSPTSELPFPVPGVAYIWQPSDQLRINIGLPFQLWYHPTEDLTFDFSYMLLRTVHARATYRLTPPLRIFVAYDWCNESYFLADRLDTNDRFFYYDMRLTTGVEYRLTPQLAIDLTGGYVFDRTYFEGHSSTDQNFNRVDVGAGPFVSLQGRFHW